MICRARFPIGRGGAEWPVFVPSRRVEIGGDPPLWSHTDQTKNPVSLKEFRQVGTTFVKTGFTLNLATTRLRFAPAGRPTLPRPNDRVRAHSPFGRAATRLLARLIATHSCQAGPSSTPPSFHYGGQASALEGLTAADPPKTLSSSRRKFGMGNLLLVAKPSKELKRATCKLPVIRTCSNRYCFLRIPSLQQE